MNPKGDAMNEIRPVLRAADDWNDWFAAGFRAHIVPWMDAVADELGALFGEKLGAAERELHAEIGELRARIVLLESLIKGKTVEIGTRKDRRDVA